MTDEQKQWMRTYLSAILKVLDECSDVVKASPGALSTIEQRAVANALQHSRIMVRHAAQVLAGEVNPRGHRHDSDD